VLDAKFDLKVTPTAILVADLTASTVGLPLAVTNVPLSYGQGPANANQVIRHR
jgi:hypothetical protein